MEAPVPDREHRPGLHLRRRAGQPDHGHAALGGVGVYRSDRLGHLHLPLYAYRKGELEPLPDVPPILRQPSATMDLVDFLYAALRALLVQGNCCG
jgi:hypothetical protein